MATEAILQNISLPAGADLSAKQFYAVTMNTSGNAVLSTAAKNITGILQNKPTSTQAATIATFGISKAVLGTGGATLGDKLEIESGGKFITVASGTAVARAMQTGAAGNTITVELLKNNGDFA